MKQQHHPTDMKTFEKGINSDANKEMLGTRQGEHVDARNMRSIPMDGDNFAKKKIKGEELLYPNIDNRCLNGTGQPLSSDYECMMPQEINGNILEVWSSPNPGEDSLIRVNGKIVLMSEDFTVDINFPLQYDKNESCIGGEFYLTDDNSRPLVFNLKDLMLNSGLTVGGETGACTDKYFDAFNIDEYVVGVTSDFYKVAFIKQPSSPSGNYDVVFGSSGVAVGYHSYSYRYVTEQGDRTGWSPQSELIPVVQSDLSGIPEHPNVGTFSKDPNVSSPSIYGNELRLKYDNANGYSFIEVRRDSFISGSPLDSQPVSELLGSFSIQTGLNTLRVLDYASPVEIQEPVDVSELTEPPLNIQSAKSIRYFGSKLWLGNVKYNSQDIDDQIVITDPNDPVFPTIEKIGKKGHTDTYNATYYKSNMRGEAQGFGIVVFDDSGAKTYATEIIDNFQFPNRRDVVSTETQGSSYKGLVLAASTDGVPGVLTHEVFDHVDAVGKSGGLYVNPLEEEVLASTKYSGAASSDTGPYDTFTPVSQVDTDSKHGQRVNEYVSSRSNIDLPRFVSDYNPQGFSLDYYAQGIAVKGVDPTALPDWADGFSVVQTNPAGRVVAQGLAYYDMIPTDGGFAGGAGKDTFSVIVHFPDLDGDIGVSPQVIDDLLVNLGASSPYKIQAVSPLGFFSEIYSFLREFTGLRNRGTDMITYCRVLRDQGLINPDWDGGLTDGYVGFGTWRDLSSNNTSFPVNTNPTLFDINSAEVVSTKTGTGTNVRLTFDQPIYSKEFTGGAGDSQDFNDPGLKEWQEPIYVVNLIKDEAQINAGISTDYNYTGHYIKLRSKVLVSNGSATQTATLVSERWEDCIRTLNGQVFNDYSVFERFVWVVDEQGNEVRWLNVDGKTVAELTIINNDINTNGFHTITDPSGSYDVYGTYTSQESTDGSATIFSLILSDVPQDSTVEVRYDNRIPVRVFGGDTFINEHIWAVHDNRYNRNGNPVDSSHDFRFNIPFPYPCYGIVDDNRIIRDTTNLSPIARYQGNDVLGLNEFRFDVGLFGGGPGINPASIRQLITMWTAETRVNLSFMFNDESDKTLYNTQTFPLKNYIPRPYKWKDGAEGILPPDSGNFLEENKMFEQYFDDYGDEWTNWGLGGFRWKPQVNTDYSQKQTTEFITTVPSVGFDEQTEFCTRNIWSVKRPINVQNSPTVKTFLPDNKYDISDDTGEIKFLWDADSPKGNNLYAITNNGVCVLLVDKRIINEINGNELATAGSDIGGVVSELWIDKNKGMDDETWRSWAEYSNTLFWANNTASYGLTGNTIKDLTETGYNELYINEFVEKIGSGFDSKMAGVYDVLHKEYYATVDNQGQSGDNHSTLIFGVSQDMLQCQSDYRYDKYLAIDNKVYGFKNLETYELGVGNLIDGEEYECYLAGVSDADVYSDKEFIRIRVNSPSKPKRIEFYDNYAQYKTGVPSSIVDATVNPINIKDYFGFECYVPRKELAPRNRQQGREMIFKIVSDEDENFFVSTVGVQYKTLK
jgi:hypothetical protein